MYEPSELNRRAKQLFRIESAVLPDEPSGDGGFLLGHLLRFGQVLRVMGVEVSTSQILDLVGALEHVPVTNRSDFYHTCRALLTTSREEFLVFDQAFRLYWRDQGAESEGGGPQPDGESRRARLPSVEGKQPVAGEQEGGDRAEKPAEDEGGEEEATPQRLMIYSADEVLYQKDFREMTWEEIQEAKQAIARLEWKLGERRTRRVRPSSKGRVHLRRMIRENLRHGGEPIHLAFRQRVYRPRSLVVLCDISGSMERYSRMLLHFIHALTHRMMDTTVEAFVFGTRLTRITRHLRYRDVDESLDELSEAVRDWSGGTRIGDALKTFNYYWARRVLGRGAVVLIISDGWDRGDLHLLAKEMNRLQRSAYRLIWLNPLLGSEDYKPEQRGMSIAMPCVDDFLPVHNLASLEQLAEVLSSMAAIRPLRKQRLCAPEPEEPRQEVKRQSVKQNLTRHQLWKADHRGLG
jgi:hypothetical protein